MTGRASPGDWRRQGQEQYLTGLEFRPADYRRVTGPTDHDHCEFCARKFSHAPGDLHTGWTTPDRSRWVCDEDYRDFAEEFGWPAPPERTV